MWGITQANDAFFKSRIPCTENLKVIFFKQQLFSCLLDRNRRGAGGSEARQGPFQILFPSGEIQWKTGWAGLQSLCPSRSPLQFWGTGNVIILQTNAHTSSLAPVSGYLLFKFLFLCCNVSGCFPPPCPWEVCPWVMCAHVPLLRRRAEQRPSFLSQNPDWQPQETLEPFHQSVAKH